MSEESEVCHWRPCGRGHTIDWDSEVPGKSRALVNLDQSKAFDKVDRWYLVAVLQPIGLGPNFPWLDHSYV